jgi:N utilization substance protein A
LSEAKKIENDFEIGEEVIEDINIKDFGRRLITIAKKTLIQKIKDLEKDNLYEKYSKIIGKIINAKIYQITNKKIILIDKDKNELILPKTEQIPKDKFKKGEYINSIIHKVYLKNNILKIILSRTSPIFLKKLLEREIPEIYDGIITIKKIVREPGEKSKVAVESYNERIDPVGSCIGIKGSRIYNIVKELKNENIDIINYTDNIELYISRILNPVKISSIKQKENKILIYIKQDQISLAIGKFGQNIRLASKLIGKEIDVYKDLDCEKKDIKIEEFQNKIDT